MGKRIIQQRRGRGGLIFRVRKRAFRVRLSYPEPGFEGEGKIVKIKAIGAYSAPIALIKVGKELFFDLAADGLHEGQTIAIGRDRIKPGNILPLRLIPIGTPIFNIEVFPGSGGKLVRASGMAGRVSKKTAKGIIITLPSKEEKLLSQDVRATIGVVAAGGRLEKPIVKAGKAWYIAKAKGKPYPHSSPVKMNVLSHPFGSGRGRNIGKSSIAPRGAPPGRKVGLLKAKKTGRGK